MANDRVEITTETTSESVIHIIEIKDEVLKNLLGVSNLIFTVALPVTVINELKEIGDEFENNNSDSLNINTGSIIYDWGKAIVDIAGENTTGLKQASFMTASALLLSSEIGRDYYNNIGQGDSFGKAIFKAVISNSFWETGSAVIFKGVEKYIAGTSLATIVGLNLIAQYVKGGFSLCADFAYDTAVDLISNPSTHSFLSGWGNGMLDTILSEHNSFTASKSVFTPRPRVDPIAIDLDGDGVETLSQADGAYFDLDKNGFAEKTGWVKGDDALLVRDLNGDGKINDGGELFGDQTILSTGVKAANGFDALAELDSNKDGKITAEDAEFSTLKIWQDKNSNRINQAA